MNHKNLAEQYNAMDLAKIPLDKKQRDLALLKRERNRLRKLLDDTGRHLESDVKKELQDKIDRHGLGIAKLEASLPKPKVPEEQEILKKFGDNFDSEFDDGTKTRFAVVTIKGLESILSQTEILRVINKAKGSPTRNKTYASYTDSNRTGIIKNGYLVNINLFQQIALLRAIEKKTGVKNKIGLYNLNGGACVHKTDATKLLNTDELRWFWTGEIHNHTKDPTTYQKAGMVYLDDKELLRGLIEKRSFCASFIFQDKWVSFGPRNAAYTGVFVLGLIMESQS